MDWPGHVEAGTIRALWVSAQWRFSPLNGWPPPGEVGLRVGSSGQWDFTEIQAALGVVSNSSPLWEAQAQIIDYCSRTGGDPAPQWAALAELSYTEGQDWRRLGGMAGFIADADVAVPYRVLASAGRIMSVAFRQDTLDGLGYTVALLPDIEECFVLCSDNPVCIRNCLRGRLG